MVDFVISCCLAVYVSNLGEHTLRSVTEYEDRDKCSINMCCSENSMAVVIIYGSCNYLCCTV